MKDLTREVNERKPVNITILRMPYPLKIMDDISRIAASKVWHRYADLFVVVVKVDTDILLKFLSAP